MSDSVKKRKYRILRLPGIYFSKLVLWLFGWKIKYEPSEYIANAVMVVAPHTSNWDFIIGLFSFRSMDLKVKVMIKKEWFFFPIGLFIRLLGGFPVDRANPRYTSSEVANQFKKYRNLMICITPEGTRKPNPYWKKGFYKIAIDANVPLALSYIDYKYKKGGVGKIFFPSGDYCSDMKFISDFYSGFNAKFPDQFVLPIIK